MLPLRSLPQALTVISVLVLSTACGGAQDESSPSAVETVTATATARVTVTAEPRSSATDSASPSKSPAAGSNETYTNLGVQVVLRGVERTSQYDDVERGTVRAGNGAEFIVLRTRVTNDAKVSMDLTCGYPIDNKLEDAEDRMFDAVQELYTIRGNPECNDQLQPGFDSAMTWIYRVPEGTEPVAWLFSDVTDFDAPSDSYTAIPLDLS